MGKDFSHTESLDFPKGEGLDISFAILVPSTKDIDKKITPAEMKQRVNEVSKFLASLVGGTTNIRAIGTYVSTQKNGKIVKERVTKVSAYTDKKTYNKEDEKIEAFVNKKKNEWNQEQMAFEYENELYFV